MNFMLQGTDEYVP